MGMTIIKNYGMPHNCYDCDLHNYHECDLTGESIEEDYCWNGDSREKHCPLREVEAIPKDQYEEQIKINNKLVNDNEQLRAYITMMQADYKARLKADMAAMLTEIQLEIEEKYIINPWREHEEILTQGMREANKVIQEKINALRGGGND